MNAKSIILEMEDLKPDDRQVYLNLADRFDAGMPSTLYLDYYELAEGTKSYTEAHPHYYEGNPGTTATQWERFLDLPEIYRYKRGKIGKLAEFDAEKAMQSLKGRTDVSAIKEILKAANMLAGGTQQREKVILTYVKPRGYKHEEAL
jgi:hypothetical protein